MTLPYERGVLSGSVIYDATPSQQACDVLYYLQRVGHFYCDAHYYVHRECYPSLLLLYVNQGLLVVDSAHHHAAQIRENTLALLDCRQPHTYYASGPLEYTWMHFSGANSGAFLRALHAQYGEIITPENPVYILDQMQQFHAQLKAVGHMNEVIASRRIHDLLCALLYALQDIPAEHPLVAQMQQHLREHLQEDISISALAATFHLSASQLNRLFRANVGQSPHEYLSNLRINHAKTLLKETALSVTEIACRVGYAYDSSFAAVFRSKVGMSPRQFRNMPI